MPSDGALSHEATLKATCGRAYPSPFYDASKARLDKRALARNGTNLDLVIIEFRDPVRILGTAPEWRLTPSHCIWVIAKNNDFLHFEAGQSTCHVMYLFLRFAEQRSRTRGRSCVRHNLLLNSMTDAGGRSISGQYHILLSPVRHFFC